MSAEAHYRQLLDLSRRMLSSGMAQQWDELVHLEQQRRALLDHPPRVAPGDSAPALSELIRQVQSCDAELLEKVEAWMSDARILLRLDATPKSEP